MYSPARNNYWRPWLVAIILAIGIFTLRWTTFDFQVWNVDEAIHATVARTLLDGGVLYRDAIDQRTPFSYYAVAAIFYFCGENNIWAMHALASGLIVLTALGLFLVATRWRNTTNGLWAAAFFAIFSTTLLYPGDAYALNTEWFVACFTTWAAWAFSRGAVVTTGLLLSLAFLSKQPALLDLGAPLIVLIFSASLHRNRGHQIAALLLGFMGPILATLLYFANHKALRDLYFYTWRYNLQYYAPEISTPSRLVSAIKPFQLIGQHIPLVLMVIMVAIGLSVWRLCLGDSKQKRATPQLQHLYLLTWFTTSLAGAASGGRGYDHYFIQFLPACCLMAAQGLTDSWHWSRAHRFKKILRPIALLGSCLIIIQLSYRLIKASPPRSWPIDPSIRTGEFIKAHTSPAERIFVWGYHPDIYLFADRHSASRFIYASFLTGLIPWTNTALGKDTTYAIVPGTRETLLRELDRTRPVFIVDCSAGPNRSWDKYPLETFPQLREFIQKNYVLAEPAQFLGQGFQLYLIQDSARLTPSPFTGESGLLSVPQLFGPPGIEAQVPADVAFAGTSPNGTLQRLELLHNGTAIAAASFPPSAGLLLKWRGLLDHFGPGDHRLSVRATASNGTTATSPEQVFSTDAGKLTAGQLSKFPLRSNFKSLTPNAGRAPLGADSAMENNQSIFYLHAPATLRYLLPPEPKRLRGQFGLRPGSYAAANLAPTDGVEFQIILIRPDNTREVLFHRQLDPARNQTDRGNQSFTIEIPSNPRAALELVITNGPAGSATSDWSYWSDLYLDTSS